ncbi:MAG: M56 family metallopeptidase [Oscillospiraceae bacterium]
MLAAALTSALLALSVMMIRRLFYRRINGKVLVLLWAAVFIKLALPVNIPCRLSVMNIPQSTREIMDTKYTFDATPPTEPVTIESNGYTYIYTEPPVTETEPAAPDLSDILYRAYIAVTALLCTLTVGAYMVCAVRFSRLPNVGRIHNVRIKMCKDGVPAAFGIFRPVIILPENMEGSRRHIILHELTHIRHHDTIWNILTLLICAVNWYNPFAWISRALFLKDTERFCDESVIRRIGEESRRAYADSLLKCAAGTSGLSLVMGFGELDVKTRIKNILHNKKVRRGAVIATACLTAVCIVCLGTGAAVRPTSQEQNTDFADGCCVYPVDISVENENAATVYITSYNRPEGSSEEFQPSNYFRFEFTSEPQGYDVEITRVRTVLRGCKVYRLFPGDRTENPDLGEVSFYSNMQNTDEVCFYAEFDFDTQCDIILTADYKLKSGAKSYDGSFTKTIPIDESYFVTNKDYESYLSRSGFTIERDGDGYEVRSDKTDICIYFTDDDYDSMTVRRHISDDMMIQRTYPRLGGFDPYHTNIEVSDLNGDSVPDLSVETYITGTGITENVITVINGADLSLMSIDKTACEKLVTSLAAKKIPTDDFSQYYPYLMGGYDFSDNIKYPLYPDTSIRRCGGTSYAVEDGVLYGCATYAMIQNEYDTHDNKDSSNVYFAKIRLDYIGSEFVPAELFDYDGTKYISTDLSYPVDIS